MQSGFGRTAKRLKLPDEDAVDGCTKGLCDQSGFGRTAKRLKLALDEDAVEPLNRIFLESSLVRFDTGNDDPDCRNFMGQR